MNSILTQSSKYLLSVTALFLAPQLLKAQNASSIGDESIPGWKHWTQQVKDLDSIIIARLPERLRNDPQVVSYCGPIAMVERELEPCEICACPR
jgi:hypothetical protein